MTEAPQTATRRFPDPEWRLFFAAMGDTAPFRIFGDSTVVTTPLRIEDVSPICLAAGAVDREAWLGLFRVADGRVALVRAVCRSGWDCTTNARCWVGMSFTPLVHYGLNASECARLGITRDAVLEVA